MSPPFHPCESCFPHTTYCCYFDWLDESYLLLLLRSTSAPSKLPRSTSKVPGTRYLVLVHLQSSKHGKSKKASLGKAKPNKHQNIERRRGRNSFNFISFPTRELACYYGSLLTSWRAGLTVNIFCVGRSKGQNRTRWQYRYYQYGHRHDHLVAVVVVLYYNTSSSQVG